MAMPDAPQTAAVPSLPGVVDPSDPRAKRAGEIARATYRLRGIRNELLGETLFSDPAWDILLDLFVAACDQRRLSVSDVCVGARSPMATVLRYLQLMLDDGLVTRVPDTNDGRRIHVLLRAETINRLLDVFCR